MDPRQQVLDPFCPTLQTRQATSASVSLLMLGVICTGSASAQDLSTCYCLCHEYHMIAHIPVHLLVHVPGVRGPEGLAAKQHNADSLEHFMGGVGGGRDEVRGRVGGSPPA